MGVVSLSVVIVDVVGDDRDVGVVVVVVVGVVGVVVIRGGGDSGVVEAIVAVVVVVGICKFTAGRQKAGAQVTNWQSYGLPYSQDMYF